MGATDDCTLESPGSRVRRAATTLVGWSDPWVMEYIGSDGGPCYNHDGNPELYGATAEEWGSVSQLCQHGRCQAEVMTAVTGPYGYVLR